MDRALEEGSNEPGNRLKVAMLVVDILTVRISRLFLLTFPGRLRV